MFQDKIKNIVPFLFLLWIVAYVLHDLKVISINMDVIPLPIVIIIFLALASLDSLITSK